MFPLFGITAARVGMNIAGNLAENLATSRSAESKEVEKSSNTQFSEALSRAMHLPKFRELRFLKQEGVTDRAEARQRVGELAEQIAHAPEIRQATCGNSRDYEMRILKDGNVELRMPNGATRTVTLSGCEKELAVEAREILEAARAVWPNSRPSHLGRANGSSMTAGMTSLGPVSAHGLSALPGADDASVEAIQITQGGGATLLP